MGRYSKNAVDYFSHHCEADDPALFVLGNKFGAIGYALYYRLRERIGASEFHVLDLRKLSEFELLLARCHCTEKDMSAMLDLLAGMGTIDQQLWEKRRIVWWQEFVDSVAHVYKNRHQEVPTKPYIVIETTEPEQHKEEAWKQ